MQGITGKGVVVAVFDDGTFIIAVKMFAIICNYQCAIIFTLLGLEWRHPDIQPNYVRTYIHWNSFLFD